MGNYPRLPDSIAMEFLNFAFKVHLPELCPRVCTIFRDYNEVFNP